jgi:hypothetical protein
VVPWSVVFAIVGDDARGMVWPDDVPVEISRQASPPRAVDGPARKREEGWKAEPGSDAKADGSAKSKKPRKRPALASVAAPEEEQPPPSRKPARAPQPIQTASAPPSPSAPSAPSAVPPAAPSRPAVGAPRKKRELPPYLRVVK